MAVRAPAVIITAKDATKRAFSSVTKGLKGIARAAGQITKRVAQVGVAAAAAGIAAMTALVVSSMKAVDELAKVSDKLGVTTEALAGLHHAAKITGVSTETMNKALQRMTFAISEAATGVGEAKDTIIELGLDAEVLNKLPLPERMAQLSDAFAGVALQSDRVRLAMDLFGGRGAAVLVTLQAGRKGLEEFAAEAEHLGLAVSRVDAAAIEQANDAVERAKGIFKGLGNQLAVAFSPIISGIADAFRQAALDSEDFGSVGMRVVDGLMKGLGMIADSFYGLRIALKEVELAFDIFSAAAGTSLRLVLNPIGSIIEGLAWLGKLAGMDIPVMPLEQQMQRNAAEIQITRDELALLYEKMATSPPSEAIASWYEEVKTKARRMAEETAKNAPGQVLLDDLENNMGPAVNAVIQKYSFMQKQIMAGQKKQTEFLALTQTERAASVIGTMSQTFGKNKALQLANAIMQTYQGATLALASYPPPLNFAMAAAVVAAGLQNVAQIKAQSFEGGGMTPKNIPRSGGVDGRGGFPAILHGNEVILDLTKRQAKALPSFEGGGFTSPVDMGALVHHTNESAGSGVGREINVSVNNTIDARGADPGVEIRIRQAMNETSAATIMRIQDLMRRRRFQ